jgi:RNA polymerase sigma-70 factor (ECF subfamily)
LLELRRAREQLDQILDAMPFEHRMVFVLHELEQTPMSEIATLAGVPQGTVASRLRRARQFFRQSVERLVKGSPLGGQEP